MKKTFGNNSSFLTYLFMIGLLTFIFFAGAQAPGYAQSISPDLYNQLKYRYVGPQGNRVIAVVGVPGNINICYAGAASGGIFKSLDGGIHWNPIFDDQPVSSIGSLAIAPSDPNIVWAGTGETFIRSNVSQGMGIYKSTDAGKNWALMGLEKTGRIGKVIIDPQNPDIVYAAAMGHCYGPQQERGVFKTKDGGRTWERVLFADENTGCSDLVMDPNNPRILFAGMWPMEIAPFLERKSGGPGGGIFASRDAGTTWKRLTGHGLPEPPIGKVALTMSASNSDRIYALIEHPDGVLWRSDDGGENWKLINKDHSLTQRPAYYSRCVATPDDYNEVYFQAVRNWVSHDGGVTVTTVPEVGGDNHDMWIDPMLPHRMMVGNDGGVRISLSRGKFWHRPNLPIAQMYHVTADNQIPYYIYGNRQDGNSQRGPSNSRTGGNIPSTIWTSVGGCECGWAIPDPVDNNIIWTGCYEGILDRHDVKTGHSRRVSVWPDDIIGIEAAPLKYRFQWTFPVAISPHDHNKVYAGSQYVHMTTDGGQTWSIISPDLSTNDKSKQQPFGGITRDDESTYSCTLHAIAESPLEKGLIWAGTNDGQLHITRDGGASWTNVTKNILNMPPMGIFSSIEPSRYDAGTCYVAVDFHNANNRNPFAYKTTDYGKTWKFLTSNVPKSELSYAHCLREDPVRKGLLYLGLENALHVSFDDGLNWSPLQTTLPHAPVHWMTIQEHFNDLVVATYGRGFWIMDDITPLQQLTPDILKSEAYLFPPRPAYRFRNIAGPATDADDQSSGQNPPYGASINYYLKAASKGDVKITILNDQGLTVRTLDGTKEAGINRIWWDLKNERLPQTKLRTSPIGAPHVLPGPEGWRPLIGEGDNFNVLETPGTYTVKLTAEGKDFTQKLTVKKDPNSAGTETDIQAQAKLTHDIQDNMRNLIALINEIEFVRKQIYDLSDLLKGGKDTEAVLKSGKDLDKKLIEIEENLFQMRLTGADQDILRLPCKLHTKISSLADTVEQSDFGPTKSQMEVHEMFKQQVTGSKARYNEIVGKDLAGFNNMLKEKNIQHVISKSL